MYGSCPRCLPTPTPLPRFVPTVVSQIKTLRADVGNQLFQCVPLLVNICRQAEIGADRAMEFDRLASAHSEYGGEDEPSNQHNPWVEEPSFLNVAAGHAQLLFQGVMFAISWHTTLLSILTVTSCARAIRLWPAALR
jgi:hypothetical protein